VSLLSCLALVDRRCSGTKISHRFRWAALQLDNIRSLEILRPRYISEALHTMPRTLYETYERILGAVPDVYFEEVRAALQWLTYSLEPVSVAQLAEACSIRIDDGKEPFLEAGGHEALIGLFGLISSLILVGEPSSEHENYTTNFVGQPLPEKYDVSCYNQHVRLAHFSVKEYLVSSRLQQSDCQLSRYALRETEVHRFLSQSCCAYLLWFSMERTAKIWIDEEILIDEEVLTDEEDSSDQESLDYVQHFTPAYPLLKYICYRWFQHQAFAEWGIAPLSIDGSLHMNVLNNERVRISWLRLADKYLALPSRSSPYSTRTRRVVGDKWHDGTNALYWASILGLSQTVSLLCDTRPLQHVSNVGGYYNTALQAAALQGDTEIVRTLIGSGADVQCKGGYHGTALQAAAFCGSENIVDMLIASGADVGTEGGCFGTALQAAAFRGNEEIVGILIASGADVGTKGGYYGTAIQAAACCGSEKIVDMLIASGADVGAEGGCFGTALQAAACHGYEKIVDMLIASGADVGTEGGSYGTALYAAANGGHSSIVTKLLQANLSTRTLNFVLDNSNTALDIACYGGYERIVEELLQAGAKVEPGALVAAAGYGYDAIVSLLLAADAYPEDVDYEDRLWPCKHAAMMGAIDFGLKSEEKDAINRSANIIKKLIDAGADVHEGNDAALCKVQELSKQATEDTRANTLLRLLLDNGAKAHIQNDPLYQDLE
jgi:ankyrin repeat protein